jgi:colicin import membrane protein
MIHLNEAWTACSREYRAETIIVMSSKISDLEKEYSTMVAAQDEQVKTNTASLAKIASGMAEVRPAAPVDTSEMKALIEQMSKEAAESKVLIQQLLSRPVVVESKEAAESKALIEQMTKEAVQSKALLEQIMMESADSKTRINELLARKPVASKVAKETIAKVLEIATSVENLCLAIDSNETDPDLEVAKAAFHERNRKAKVAEEAKAKAAAEKEAKAKAAKEAKIKAAREALALAEAE